MPIKSEQAIKVLRYRGDDWNEDDRLLRQAMDFGATAIFDRDALAARVAELEGALECIPVDLINAIENGEKVRIFLSTESCKLIGAALSRTPAQSLAACKAAALRAAAKDLESTDINANRITASGVRDLFVYRLLEMAERLETEAANGLA